MYIFTNMFYIFVKIQFNKKNKIQSNISILVY